jgi:hypothetical protein
MHRRRPYCFVNPLTGIWVPCGTVLGYNYASPDGDFGPYIVTPIPTELLSLQDLVVVR